MESTVHDVSHTQVAMPDWMFLTCRALVAILPESAHKDVLRELCAQLAVMLEEADDDIESRLPTIMQALSSIGRVAPDIFAEHAGTVADFVLDVRPILSLEPSWTSK